MIRLIGKILTLSFLFSPPLFAQPSQKIQGLWLTENGRAKVEISPCQQEPKKLCGLIKALKEPLTTEGKPKFDHLNPEPSLRARPLMGLSMLQDFEPRSDDPHVWENGTIYNPSDGKTYSCTLTLQENQTLEVHGYVGIPLFGKTQIWKKSS